MHSAAMGSRDNHQLGTGQDQDVVGKVCPTDGTAETQAVRTSGGALLPDARRQHRVSAGSNPQGTLDFSQRQCRARSYACSGSRSRGLRRSRSSRADGGSVLHPLHPPRTQRSSGFGGRSRERSSVIVHLCEVLRLVAPQESDRNPTWFSANKAKRRLQEDRTPEFGAELARVLDRAVSRIQRPRGKGQLRFARGRSRSGTRRRCNSSTLPGSRKRPGKAGRAIVHEPAKDRVRRSSRALTRSPTAAGGLETGRVRTPARRV